MDERRETLGIRYGIAFAHDDAIVARDLALRSDLTHREVHRGIVEERRQHELFDQVRPVVVALQMRGFVTDDATQILRRYLAEHIGRQHDERTNESQDARNFDLVAGRDARAARQPP